MTDNEKWLMGEFRRMRDIRNALIALVIALLVGIAFAVLVTTASGGNGFGAPITNIGRIIIPESTTLQLECESGFVVSTPEPTTVILSCHRARDEAK